MPVRARHGVRTFSATIHGDVDWERLPAAAPAALRDVVERLLQREPNDRAAGHADDRERDRRDPRTRWVADPS
jgi:hypothetical protein